jgi:hypothetical protein
MKPLYSILTVLAISIAIHASISYLNHLENKKIVDKIDQVGDRDAYLIGYREGYHIATKDLAYLNSTPEQH